MPKQCTYVMFTKLLIVIQQLLGIVSKCTQRSFFERTVVGRVCIVINKRTFCIRITPVVIISIGIEGECQVFRQVNIGITTGNK